MDRWANIERHRIYFTCMQPKAVCIGGKCSSQQKVPEVLLCKGCEIDAQARGWALLNILLCRKKEHSQLRAHWKDLINQLEHYFVKFSSNIEENDIQISAHFLFQVHAATPHQYVGWCSLDTNEESELQEYTPTIDSSPFIHY